MVDAISALRKLLNGNSTYVRERVLHYEDLDKAREENSEKHEPIALVLGCSDARVPLEIIFHQGPGDLFVIRIAGNILNEDILASVKYAVKYLHVNLVMVMGHDSCGAVTAALSWKDVQEPLKGLLSRIEIKPGSKDICENVKHNAVSVAENIRPHIQAWNIEDRVVEVVPTFYSFSTGLVEILENDILNI